MTIMVRITTSTLDLTRLRRSLLRSSRHDSRPVQSAEGQEEKGTQKGRGLQRIQPHPEPVFFRLVSAVTEAQNPLCQNSPLLPRPRPPLHVVMLPRPCWPLPLSTSTISLRQTIRNAHRKLSITLASSIVLLMNRNHIN
jgi:hypothetical protein